MKRLIYIYIVALLFNSCSSDFLDLGPQHYGNETNFFKTEDHFDQAINGVYEALRGVHGFYGTLMSEMRSDNTHYTRYEADRSQHQYEEAVDFTNDALNTMTDDMYYNCYLGISRANSVLDRIEGTPFSEDFKNHIIGQARFLRAYFYFQLVQYYGGVPLYLHEVKGVEDSFLPRSSVEDVYTTIINDALDAVSKLPVVKFPQDGSATQGAARMLLAYSLISQPNKDYAGAEAQLKEILKMGYELLPDYGSIYEPSNKNHKESLFEIQYQQGDQGQQSDWLYYFIPRMTEGEIITGVAGSNTISLGGWNVPTQEMLDSYEPGDLRVNPSVAVAAGHNDEYDRFVCDKVFNVSDSGINDYPVFYYFINKYRHPHIKIKNTDDNWPVYRYSDVLLLLAECLVEQGRAGEATPYVNQVRQRAGLNPLTNVDTESVANERRHELAFEGHRWFDLLRTGEAIEVMNEYGKRMKALYPYLTDRTYQVTKEKLLFPIPFREIQINSQLEQNTGY